MSERRSGGGGCKTRKQFAAGERHAADYIRESSHIVRAAVVMPSAIGLCGQMWGTRSIREQKSEEERPRKPLRVPPSVTFSCPYHPVCWLALPHYEQEMPAAVPYARCGRPGASPQPRPGCGCEEANRHGRAGSPKPAA